MKFFIKDLFSKLVTFIEEILHKKIHSENFLKIQLGVEKNCTCILIKNRTPLQVFPLFSILFLNSIRDCFQYQ